MTVSVGDKVIVAQEESGKNIVIPIDIPAIGNKTAQITTSTKDIVLSLNPPAVGDKVYIAPSKGGKNIAIKTGSSLIFYKDILVIGGFNNFVSRYNDTWYSVDQGASWTQQSASAGWVIRDEAGAAITTRAGSVIVCGGQDNVGNYLNDVWKSTNLGVTWTQQTASAEWEGRGGHRLAILLDGSILLSGGLGYGDVFYKHEIWHSLDDGATWHQHAHAPWSERTLHRMLTLPNGKVIVMGGAAIDGTKNDVWISSDSGETWTQQTASAGWSARYGLGATVLPDGSIIVSGGEIDSPAIIYNDVWISTDQGATWTQQTASAEWAIRNKHGMIALADGSVLVMGGSYGGGYYNDVWHSLDKGVTWHQHATGVPWWTTREGFGCLGV